MAILKSITNMNSTAQFKTEDNSKLSNRHPLSANQQALWFVHALGGKAQSAYNETLLFLLEGKLVLSILQDTFSTIISKHEAFRTCFKKDDNGNLFQFLNKFAELDIQTIEEIASDKISQCLVEAMEKPFNLRQAPLMRVLIVKISEAEYILTIVQHHIITDGVSSAILLKDLCSIYNRKIRSLDGPQEAVNTLRLGHSLSANTLTSTEVYKLKVKKIVDSLKGYAGLNFLTTLKANQGIDIFSGDRVYFSLNKEIYLQLKEFSKAQKTTLFNFLFAAYCVFLNKYTRSQDIVIGVPFANRSAGFNKDAMGFFVNTLPIRIGLNLNSKFTDFVSNMRRIVFSYLDKQEVALEHVVSQLNLDGSNDRHRSLIQTLFVWSPHTEALQLNLEGVSSKLMHHYFPKTSKFDLSLFMLEENHETITAYFEFRDKLFDRAMVESFAKSFTLLVQNILHDPELVLSSFSMLDAAEKYRMKEKFFRTKLDRVVATSLGALFTETSRRYAHHRAMVFGNKSYNYADLEHCSNQWAHYIRQRYMQIYQCEMPRDTLIGLCVDRHEDMIFGILGILKAGAAYVPIDPRYPRDRVEYILNDSKASLLLTHQVHGELLKQFDSNQLIYMDTESVKHSLKEFPITLNLQTDPKDIAYVLYTSGSTGRPKGVAVSHENVICLFESLKKEFILSEKDVWSLFHTFSFDISVWEIWGAFLYGGRLVVIPYEISRDPKSFYKLLESEQVTVLTQTSSAFQMLVKEDLEQNKKLECLRYVAFVGESLKVSILRPWIQKYGVDAPKLANMYGITETTVYTNCKFITQKDVEDGRDNIGWPLEDFSMCILDENLQWCPVGVVGEIYIGGRGLSRGYLYRGDLTQEKFIPDPHAGFLGLEKNAKLYRTGDLGRWLEDGSIEYLGRKDFQIKLRGFRIELGEIEAAIGSYDGILQAIVLLKGEGENAYLAAYYTANLDVKVTGLQLTSHLKSFLPEYMVPHTFTEIPSFPMTVNGKVDRQALGKYDDRTSLSECDTPLASDLEFEIAQIWARILNIDIKNISPKASFFELGGNSLLVVKMLTEVGKKLGRDLSVNQFMGIPNIASLAGKAEKSIASNNASTQQFLERLRRDVALDPAIKPLKNANSYIFHPKTILLTGATGFLGAHLLHELLVTTEAKIYCLVRAASCEEAMNKIKEKSIKYCLATHRYFDRIIPLLGSLDQENLGMSVSDFTLAVDEVDTIYHVGAWVHHIFDYETLCATNVQSTIQLLKVATSRKNKALHFVSTLGAAYISPLEKLPVLPENSSEVLLNFNGYLTSKWVAEQLLKEAWRRGIAAHVYRPGNIVAGKLEIYEPHHNHILLRLKGILQLGKAYIDQEETLEMMPVDLLASTLVKISHSPKKSTYNLNNQQRVSWVDYLEFAKKIGYSITHLKTKEEWDKIVAVLDENNPFYLFSFLYTGKTASYKGDKPIDHWQSDFTIPVPPYTEIIEKQFVSLINCGFLDRPDKH